MIEDVPIILKFMAKDRSVGASFKESAIHHSGTFIDHKNSDQNIERSNRRVVDHGRLELVGLLWTIPQRALRIPSDHCHTGGYKVEC